MAVAHLLTAVPVVKAQSSTVQCLSRFDWVGHKTTSAVIDLPIFGQMSNSRNQNPCLVAAYAMSVCLPRIGKIIIIHLWLMLRP